MSMFNRKSEPTAPVSQPVSPPVLSEQPNRTLTPARPSGLLSKGVSIKGSVKFLNELLIDGEVKERLIRLESSLLGRTRRLRARSGRNRSKCAEQSRVIFSRQNAANCNRAAPCAVISKYRDSWLTRMRHLSAVRKLSLRSDKS